MKLTTKHLEHFIAIRDEICKRTLKLAEIYFDNHPQSDTSHYFSLTTSDYDLANFRIYANSKIRVNAASETGHHEDSVSIPLAMLTREDYKDAAKAWCKEAKEKREQETRISELITLDRYLKKYYPEGANQIMKEIDHAER